LWAAQCIEWGAGCHNSESHLIWPEGEELPERKRLRQTSRSSVHEVNKHQVQCIAEVW
jgi:hypothetical protein